MQRSNIQAVSEATVLSKKHGYYDIQILFFARGLLGMDFLLQFENIKFDFKKELIET